MKQNKLLCKKKNHRLIRGRIFLQRVVAGSNGHGKGVEHLTEVCVEGKIHIKFKHFHPFGSKLIKFPAEITECDGSCHKKTTITDPFLVETIREFAIAVGK